MRSFLLSLFLIVCLEGLSQGDGQFTEPDGRLNDLEQKFTVGDTLNIEWVAGWIGSGEQPDFVDLFITWFDSDSYSELLIANTTTKQAGFYPWKINVTADVVEADDAFVLRFRPHRDPEDYNNGGPMAPSRGFLIQLASSASSATTTLTSSAMSTLSVPSTSVSTTALPTSTMSTISEGRKSSKNVGAIVGGIIGGIAVIVLVIIAVLLFRIWKRKKAQEAATSNNMPFVGYNPQISEAEGVKYFGAAATPELDGNQLPVEASIGTDTAR